MRKRHQHAHSTTLAEVRAVLLVAWDVFEVPDLAAGERAYLDELWNELRSVEAVGAWRSVIALAGQFLEAALKHRLRREGVDEQQLSGARGTLGALTEEAQRRGLFTSPSAGLTVGGSISAARRMRNLASHASPWQRHPTERRATLALVLLVGYLGYLFPELDGEDVQPLRLELRTCQPGSERFVELVEVLVRRSGPRGVTSLIEYAISAKWQHQLRPVVASNFHFVVAHAGSGRARNAVDLLTALTSLGMRRPHAELLGILLPTDSDALEYFIERSPKNMARYLYMCQRADPELFSSWDDQRFKLLAGHLERAIRRRSISIPNVGNILNAVPTRVRVQVLRDSAPALVAWAADEPPSDSLALLKAAHRDTRAPELRALMVDLAEAIAQRVIRGDDQELSSIPLRLHQLQLTQTAAGDLLFERVLVRSRDLPSETRQRLLWDTAVFGPPGRAEQLKAEVARAAAEGPASLGVLDYMSVVGTALALGLDMTPAVDPKTVVPVFDASLHQAIDRFRIARMLVAVAKMVARPALDPEFVRLARQRLSETDVDEPISARVVALALDSLSNDGTVNDAFASSA
jgi:hypothetical protein